MRNFFISYNHADERWAEWIAWTLSDADYTHYFQKWDFRPGGNFVLDMQNATVDSERTLLVLTASYLSSLYTQPEWAAAFARDPTGERRLMLPIRVEPCEPAGMLKAIAYCDLVGLAVADARNRLLDAIKPSGKPETAVAFPGAESTVAAFPGPKASTPSPVDSVRSAAEELRSIFATTRTTFKAQARLRDDLSDRIHNRLQVQKHHQYEELFDLYFDRLQPDELRLHGTIRAYTESILHEYNERTLQIIEHEPALENFLPSFPALKQHLIIWLNKFDRVFLRRPSMCLLYVGVEEGVGFPGQIEHELRHYLDTGTAAPKINWPAADELNEELSGGTAYIEWMTTQHRQRARLPLLEKRIADLTNAEAVQPINEFRTEELIMTEEAYSNAIRQLLSPGWLNEENEWLARLEALSRDVDAAIQPKSSPNAVEAARALHRVVFDEMHTTMDGKKAKLADSLCYLVRLKQYERELGLGSEVSDLWSRLSSLLRSENYDA